MLILILRGSVRACRRFRVSCLLRQTYILLYVSEEVEKGTTRNLSSNPGEEKVSGTLNIGGQLLATYIRASKLTIGCKSSEGLERGLTYHAAPAIRREAWPYIKT